MFVYNEDADHAGAEALRRHSHAVEESSSRRGLQRPLSLQFRPRLLATPKLPRSTCTPGALEDRGWQS